jgi:hypothetical protein
VCRKTGDRITYNLNAYGQQTCAICGERPADYAATQRNQQANSAEALRRSGFFCPAAQKEKFSIIVPHNDLAVNVEIENSFQQMPGYTPSSFEMPGYTPSSFVASFIILRSDLLMARLVGLERSRGRCRVDKWRLWIVTTGCVLISMDKMRVRIRQKEQNQHELIACGASWPTPALPAYRSDRLPVHVTSSCNNIRVNCSRQLRGNNVRVHTASRQIGGSASIAPRDHTETVRRCLCLMILLGVKTHDIFGWHPSQTTRGE